MLHFAKRGVWITSGEREERSRSTPVCTVSRVRRYFHSLSDLVSNCKGRLCHSVTDLVSSCKIDHVIHWLILCRAVRSTMSNFYAHAHTQQFLCLRAQLRCARTLALNSAWELKVRALALAHSMCCLTPTRTCIRHRRIDGERVPHHRRLGLDDGQAAAVARVVAKSIFSETV